MTRTIEKTGDDQRLLRAVSKLADQLQGVGVSLSLFGRDEAPLHACAMTNEVCQRLCHQHGVCQSARAEGIKDVWTDGKARVLDGPAGCVMLAVPVLKRRRMTAVAIACYLTPDLGANEEFRRSCDVLHLDSEYLASVAAASHCHPRSEAEHWLDIVQMLINQQMENVVAQDELTSFSHSLSSTYEELSLLYRLSGAMKVNVPPADFFRDVCGELLSVMQVESAAAVLTQKAGVDPSDAVVGAGEALLSDDEFLNLSLMIHRERLDDDTGRGVVISESSPILGPFEPRLKSMLVVPLIAGDMSMGLLLALNKIDAEFDSSDLKLMHSVAVQAAVFLANQRLYGEVQELLMGVLHVLTASIDAKDQYTCGHSQRVAMISRKLAEMCNFDPKRVEDIYLAGLLHDIGKIGVPEDVLCKPGKLSEDEFTTMKRHPVIGANILSNIRQIQSVLPGVMYHHERMDGRGYPDGLAGEAIPIDGRIVGLADCLDAMTSSRTYRKALPLERVKAEILRCSGTQFDPMLVDHLFRLDLEEFLAELRQAKPMVSAISGIIRSGES